MIIYLDASALVKRYIFEQGSAEVDLLIVDAQSIATNLISRAEVSAAIMRAARLQILRQADAKQALDNFRSEWESLQRLPVNETTVARADALVVEYDLRGYDSVHLAAALIWQEALDETIVMATFDDKLRRAAQESGLNAWPKSG
jgi:predicted nucleic acid-binding protein